MYLINAMVAILKSNLTSRLINSRKNIRCSMIKQFRSYLMIELQILTALKV